MTVRLHRVTPSPDVFAAVMATGVLSVAARNHHYRWISEALGVLATVGLLALVTLVVLTAAASHRVTIWDLADPDVTLRLFTFVAACAVLDSRLTAHPMVARGLGAVALASWVVLLVLTARNMARRRWTALRDHAHGAWELASVGTSGLAIITARAGWVAVAVPIWMLGIAVYALMTWLILWRTVSERTDREGFEPDDWILMGAMAIATLAGDDIHRVAPEWTADWVRLTTIVTWVVASLWMPPLIYFVLHRVNRHPGVLRFTGVWWTVVFPLGMYSVATDASAAELGAAPLRTVSLVFFWDALTAWLIVVVAGSLRLRHVFLRRATAVTPKSPGGTG